MARGQQTSQTACFLSPQAQLCDPPFFSSLLVALGGVPTWNRATAALGRGHLVGAAWLACNPVCSLLKQTGDDDAVAA